MVKRFQQINSFTVIQALLIYISLALAAYAQYPSAYAPSRSWLSDLGDVQHNPKGAVFYNLGIVFAGLLLFALSRSPRRAARLPSPRQNSTVLCFLVDDFEAERRALEARGVTFEQAGEQEWGRFAHFRDPEGNELQIYQPRPGYS